MLGAVNVVIVALVIVAIPFEESNTTAFDAVAVPGVTPSRTAISAADRALPATLALISSAVALTPRVDRESLFDPDIVLPSCWA
jgi:hypothetical protein